VTIGSSLGAVLGLFLVMAWVLRRAAPAGSAWLPGEVVEVLGRSVLAGRAQVHLVRCGNRLLLLSVTPSGIETLTEISDPDEVNHLTALCRQGRPGSVTAAFRRVLDELAGEAESPEIAGAGRQGRAVPGVEPLRDRGIREGRHV
jgi:flagellar biogenesis protein FliO